MEEAGSYTTGTVQKKLKERPRRTPEFRHHSYMDVRTSIKLSYVVPDIAFVYRVEDDIVTVTVIGVGKRENDDIYNATLNRN